MYKVTRFYEEAQLPENGYGRVKWNKASAEEYYSWTQENVNNCISKDTLKYFRKVFNSKQVIRYQDNKIILYSYAPDRLDYRYTTIMEEV